MEQALSYAVNRKTRIHYQVEGSGPRGQGQSDKPHTPDAYTMESRVADVIAVLDAIGPDRVHFWGYSLGGMIGFQVARTPRSASSR